jgi:integrase
MTTEQTELPPGLRRDPKTGPNAYLIQLSRKGERLTRRFDGTLAQALKQLEAAKVDLGRKIEAATQPTTSKKGSVVPFASCPTLAEWLVGRYAQWQERAQNERTRRKLVAPIRYLLASDLADKRLDWVDVEAINLYVEWRQRVGAITFAERKDGGLYRPRVGAVGAQTINKSLKVLSSALHLAHDESKIVAVPKIGLLPEDDAEAIVPPSEEQYLALLRAAPQQRRLAPLLPELIEFYAEFGLRPAEALHLEWGSVDWKIGVGENRGAIRVEQQKRTRVVGGETWKPKNRRWRMVPCTPRGRELLEKLREQAPKARPDDLVFPNENGLPYMRIDNGPMKGGGAGIWKRLREVSAVEGVSIRDLRHYFAVQCLLRGIPLDIVSKWMGHSSTDITSRRYGRWAAEAKEQWHWAGLRAKSVKDLVAKATAPLALATTGT